MKQYTQKEFDNFTRGEFGYLQCPAGDYSLIKKFPEMCSFGRGCIFGEGCTCEDGHKFKSLFTAGYLGRREGQTYFWLLEDGSILVRCAAFAA